MTTEAARQREPDGRPLYAYKWHDAYYERLKTGVRAQIPGALRGREDRRFSAMFCVYAAETFRRRHAGGPWTWETVFAEIGQAVPDYQTIYTWVDKGLRHFNRPLLRSRNGDREFLVTLACEGGLPLRLLHKENAHLSRYFRELLTAYHRDRHLPGCDATDIARHVAARYLPASLRHEVVFNLSGDLIRSVVQLQGQVADATDPLTSLDRTHPAWREALPLPVEEATVEALLRNLVGQARTLAQTERQRWRWHCVLVPQGEHWSIAQHLELPRIVTGASLYAWSHWNDPPTRLRVLLHTTEGIEAIALLTRLQGMGDQATYRCEGLRRGGVRLLGSVAAAGLRLVLNNGDMEVELPMLGGHELGPLPWVFVERGTPWEWYGEGSVRSRDTSVRVLTPGEGHYNTGVDGACTSLGRAPELQRVLCEITGTVAWQHPELGTCHIRCASEEASEASFLVDGKTLSGVLNLRPPFRGMPSLYAIGRDEVRRRIDSATLEWRPLDAPETAWCTDTAACAGRVWVRYRDASGALRFRRQIEVVPTTAHVAIARIGACAAEAGSIRLTGLSAVRITVPEVAGCLFQPQPIDDGVAIDCAAQASLPITQFRADLQWPDGRVLTLMVPFPRQGAAFVRAGQVLPPKERVALGRLAALQAVVHTPTGGGRFYLEGRLSTAPPGHGKQVLRESLRTTSNEPLYFALYRVQERLTAMLAMTGNLDAAVTLDIMDGEGHPLASVDVAQFDVALEPDRAHNLVRMPQSSLERLNDGWEERLTVKMLPLWEPATTPVDLVRDQATSAWRVPEGLAPGPWWVLGRESDWARCRPLLWAVHGEQTLADGSELMQAIREPVRERRQGRLRTLVRALATNTEHPDWPRLFDYLPLTRTYPAGALDLLHHVIHDPEAMIVALLKSTDEEFDLVWSLAEQLPFSWHLVPVIRWLLAAERHFGVLRAGLADYDPDGALLWGFFRDFRERVTSHQPFFKSVCDWIGRQLFPDRPLENSELAMARHHPAMLTALMQEHERALQARHDADERYPDGPCIMERTRQSHFPAPWRYERLAEPFRPVRCAPFAAAQMSLDAEHGSKELLLELRQLRDFDPEWFDNAFACALCLGLAQRPVGREGTSL